MEVKHTKGPWEIRRHNEWRSENTYPQVWTPKGLLLNGVGNIPGEDRDANARLIAAAPDHYTNARELVRMADEGYSLRDADGAQHPEWEYLLENAREAIAKAEGGGE